MTNRYRFGRRFVNGYGFGIALVLSGISCSGDERLVNQAPGTIVIHQSDPSWSPEGDRLAYVEDTQVVIRELGSRVVSSVARGSSPTWSPDDSRVAYQDPAGRIWLADLTSQSRDQITFFGELSDWEPDGFSRFPDFESSSRLLFNHQTGLRPTATFWILDLMTGERVDTRVAGTTASWLAEDEFISTGVGEHHVERVRWTSLGAVQETLFTLESQKSFVRYPAVRPGTIQYTYMRFGGSEDKRGVWIAELPGGAGELLVRDGWKSCWSPDGMNLAYERIIDDTLRILLRDIGTGEESRIPSLD